MACSMVGDGSIGPPSLHIFPFQLWQVRLSASRMSASAIRRFALTVRPGSSSWRAPSPAPFAAPCGRRQRWESGDIWAPSRDQSAVGAPRQIIPLVGRGTEARYRPSRDAPHRRRGWGNCGRNCQRMLKRRLTDLLRPAARGVAIPAAELTTMIPPGTAMKRSTECSGATLHPM